MSKALKKLIILKNWNSMALTMPWSKVEDETEPQRTMRWFLYFPWVFCWWFMLLPWLMEGDYKDAQNYMPVRLDQGPDYAVIRMVGVLELTAAIHYAFCYRLNDRPMMELLSYGRISTQGFGIFLCARYGISILYNLYFIDHVLLGIWTLQSLRKNAKRAPSPEVRSSLARAFAAAAPLPALAFGALILLKPERSPFVLAGIEVVPAGHFMYGMMYCVLGVYKMGVARAGTHPAMYLIQPINNVVVLFFMRFFPPVAGVLPAGLWDAVLPVHIFGLLFSTIALLVAVDEYSAERERQKRA